MRTKIAMRVVLLFLLLYRYIDITWQNPSSGSKKKTAFNLRMSKSNRQTVKPFTPPPRNRVELKTFFLSPIHHSLLSCLSLSLSLSLSPIHLLSHLFLTTFIFLCLSPWTCNSSYLHSLPSTRLVSSFKLQLFKYESF